MITMSREEFKPIKGFEDRYLISNFGRVISLRYRSGPDRKELKKYMHNRGYWQVDLYKNKKNERHRVHQLVAKYFVPNPKKLPHINHKDGDKLNNIAENLEWVTNKQNIQHAHKNGLFDYTKKQGSNNAMSKLSPSDVAKIYLLGDYFSNQELSRMFNISYQTITRIRSKRGWKSLLDKLTTLLEETESHE